MDMSLSVYNIETMASVAGEKASTYFTDSMEQMIRGGDTLASIDDHVAMQHDVVRGLSDRRDSILENILQALGAIHSEVGKQREVTIKYGGGGNNADVTGKRLTDSLKRKGVVGR